MINFISNNKNYNYYLYKIACLKKYIQTYTCLNISRLDVKFLKKLH